MSSIPSLPNEAGKFSAAHYPGRAKRDRFDRFFKGLCLAACMAACLILVVLLGKLLFDGLPRISGEFLTRPPSEIARRAGILTPLMGSLFVMLLTMAFVVPVGVAAAIYLEELTPKKTPFIRFIQLNIANLAGVPSIVFGMLGLALFVVLMGMDKHILTGALTMGILVLPMVILVSQEALKAVPRNYREASLAMGCTTWQTVRRIVLPVALPGILTGVILAAARAIGETAPLIVVGAVGLVTSLPTSVTDRYTVLPLQILDWSQRPSPDFRTNAAGAIVALMLMLLILNSAAIIIRARAQRRL